MILLLGAAAQGKPVAAADTAEKPATSRANDYLSAAEFADPLTHARPGCILSLNNNLLARFMLYRLTDFINVTADIPFAATKHFFRLSAVATP